MSTCLKTEHKSLDRIRKDKVASTCMCLTTIFILLHFCMLKSRCGIQVVRLQVRLESLVPFCFFIDYKEDKLLLYW